MSLFQKKPRIRHFLFYTILMIISLSLLTFFIVSIIAANKSFNLYNNESKIIIQSLTTIIDNALHEPEYTLSELAYIIDIQKDSSITDKSVANIFELFPYYQSIQILDNNGIVIDLYPKDSTFLGWDYSNTDFFNDVKNQKRIIWSSTHISLKTNTPITTLIMPFNMGYIMGVVDLQSINNVIQKIIIPAYYHIRIIDQNGTYIVHENKTAILQREIHPNFSYIKKKSFLPFHYYTMKEKGIKYLSSFTKIRGAEWIVEILYEYNKIIYPIIFQYGISILIISLLGSIIVLFSLKQISKINTSIELFTNQTKYIAKGDYKTALPEQTYIELDFLRNNFQEMMEKINIRESEIKQSESIFRTLFEQGYQFEAILTVDGKILNVNRTILDFMKVSKDALIDAIFWDTTWFSTTYINKIKMKNHIKQAKQGHTSRFECIQYGSDEKIHTIDYTIKPIMDDGGTIMMIIVEGRDISELKNYEETVSEEKERLSVTLQSISDSVITTDIDGKVLLLNASAEKLTGWSLQEAIEKNLDSLILLANPENREQVPSVVEMVSKTKSVQKIRDNILLINRYEKEILIQDSGSPFFDRKHNIVGIVIVIRDITEIKKIENKMIISQRLESLGILAGGIAHDFNNLLGGLFGYLGIIKMLIKDNSEAFEYLEEALKVFNRTKGLTQQLLSFSKGYAPVKKFVDIENLLKNSSSLILTGSNIIADFSVSADLWPCEVDENQLGQVLDNIILNARQSMENGGTISISAKSITFPIPNPISDHIGNFIKISIKDHGTGISKTDLEKIFDPFYTTKKGGSGLGLTSSFSIIKKHGGTIDVESTLGKGSIFHIFLPAIPGKTIIEKLKHEISLNKNKGNILIMDDEDFILEIAETMLLKYGYAIDTVKNGDEALAAIKNKKKKNQYEIVICDLTVKGGKGGKEIINEILDYDKDIKVIASSGYSHDPIMAHYKDYGFTDILPKPYEPEDLIDIINRNKSK